MPLQLIPNEQLLLDRIPDPEAELWGWERFAHTINGYEVMGGFEPCADLANRGTPTTLTELRCSLKRGANVTAVGCPPTRSGFAICCGRFGRRWKPASWIEVLGPRLSGE